MTLTERDLRLVRWINGWGSVTVFQIAFWLGVDFSTAARRVRKLVEAGFLCRLSANGMAIQPIAATKLGCRAAQNPLAPLMGASGSRHGPTIPGWWIWRDAFCAALAQMPFIPIGAYDPIASSQAQLQAMYRTLRSNGRTTSDRNRA